MKKSNKMGNKDKGQDLAATSEGDLTSPRDAYHTNRDLSHEREAQKATGDAAIARQVAEATAREMSKAHMQY